MNEATRQLFHAAYSGNVKKVDELLKHGLSPNARDDQQKTLLSWAAMQGHTPVVKKLLLHGAKPEAMNPDGWTPLKLAENKKHTIIVHILRNYQSGIADWLPEVGHLLNNRVALLRIMFDNGDEDHDIIKALLEKGTNPNLTNEHGCTTLSYSSMCGRFFVVALLLNYGADPNVGSNSFLALELAAFHGHTQISEILLAHKANVNAENSNGWTALMSASRYNHIEVVKLLLEHNADPMRRNSHGENAIAQARSGGHQSIVQLLLTAEKTNLREARVQNSGNKTIKLSTELIEAAKTNSTSRIDLLIKSGATSNAIDKAGRSALSYASEYGNSAAVRTLLAHKANPNQKDKDGRTVLSYAVLHQNNAVLDYLLCSGANPDTLATGISEPIVIEGIAEPVVIALTPLHLASMSGNTRAITKLIEYGADRNILSSNELTPLHWAAACGQVGSIKELIDKNADLEATNDANHTVLMAAAEQGQDSAIKFLVNVIDNIDEKDNSGETALMYAVRDNHLEAVEALLEAGADMIIENDDGETAWSIAISEGHTGIAKMLEAPSLPFHQIKKTAPLRQPKGLRQVTPQTSLPLEKSVNTPNPNDLFSQLSSLTGLINVKAEVTQLVNFLRVQQMRKQKGLSVPDQSLHMVFTGNPGTGKTTIARLIAQIYKSMGILSGGQFIETDRVGLIGGYLGQTGIKTQKIVESALGGVLFIDEAYSLTEDTYGRDMYGQEAIATLLKMMEDHRDDLIVIVAGYTEPMQKFIKSNPGLQSRFNKFLHFDDYAPGELTEIFRHFAGQGDYKLHPATELKLHNVFADLYARRDETFGNARLARNMFEKAINAHANRMVSAGMLDEANLVTLYPEDVPSM